jgi:dimeric dUTPase (all-alpha-NTP-PPase superfamily)
MDFRVYYEQQKKLQTLFKEKYPGSEAVHTGLSATDEAKFKDHVLLMIKEVTEILDEINYKPHVHNKKPINKDHIIEELVDTFKFLLNLMLIMDVQPYEFERKYAEKHKKVIARVNENL